MKRWSQVGLLLLWVGLFSCSKPTIVPVSQALAAIDTLMQCQPDSALNRLLPYYDTVEDRHYANLLLSELLYKNDYEQTNRDELLDAMAWYDSVAEAHPHDKDIAFLDARCHYMNGVGYYEMDSVVAACAEYLKALEIMETHFEEKDLVGYKAKFMALTHTRLCTLFSDQYLHEQAIYFGKQALLFYNKYDAEPWNIAWMFDEIGSQYEMKGDLDSAQVYYQKGIDILPDTNTITYRDLRTHIAFNSYTSNGDILAALTPLYDILKQAESDRELLSRCLIIGSVYYYDFQYDSAYRFLSKVYHHTSSVGSKKISAEWLVDICDNTGRSYEVQEYASYLIPFANIDEKLGILRSRLIKTYIEHEQNRKEYLHRQIMKKALKQVGFAVFGLQIITIIVVLISFFKNKKKNQKMQNQMEMTEKQLEEERYAHRVQQAALGSRLKKKNQALKDLRSSISLDQPIELPSQAIQGVFVDEPICKYILKICEDKKNSIKSTIPYSAYVTIALSNRQKAQLKEAANKHYGELFERIKKQYPELKEKDLLYCYLSLLELSNTQIAALLQKSISTIWNREKRIQAVFGKQDSVVTILNDFINN